MPIHTLSEELVEEVSKSHRALAVLTLADNRIARIENLGRLTRLEKLDLSNNTIGALKNVACLPRLRELRLASNRICGLDPSELKLPRLELLDLSDNLIADPTQLVAFATLPLLANLALAGNPVVRHQEYSNVLGRALPLLEALDGKAPPWTSGDSAAATTAAPAAPAALLPVLAEDRTLGGTTDGTAALADAAVDVAQEAMTAAVAASADCAPADSERRAMLAKVEHLEAELLSQRNQHAQLQGCKADLEAALAAERGRCKETRTQLLVALEGAETLQAEFVRARGEHAAVAAQAKTLRSEAERTAAASQAQQQELVAALEAVQEDFAAAEDKLAAMQHVQEAQGEAAAHVVELEALLQRERCARMELASHAAKLQAEGEVAAAAAAAAHAELAVVRKEFAVQVAELKAVATAEGARSRKAVAAAAAVNDSLCSEHRASVEEMQRCLEVCAAPATPLPQAANAFRPSATVPPTFSGKDGEAATAAMMMVEGTEGALRHQLQLLKVRLEATQTIVAIQEEELGQLTPAGIAAGGTLPPDRALLSRWRCEVFQLLLAQRQAALAHEQEMCGMAEQLAALKVEAQAARMEAQLLTQRDMSRAAELEMERAAAVISTKALRMLQAREVTLTYAVEAERAGAHAMAEAVAQQRVVLEADMQQLQRAAASLNSYAQRLAFAEGRVRVAMELKGLRQAHPAVQPAPGLPPATATTITVLPPSAAVGDLEREVAQLQAERVMLVATLKGSPAAGECDAAMARAATAEATAARLQEAADITRVQLEDMHSQLEATQRRVEGLRCELEESQRQLPVAVAEAVEAAKVTWRRAADEAGQVAATAEQQHRKQCAALVAERDTAVREADRLHVVMRGMERELARLKDHTVCEDHARLDQLQEEAEAREEQLRALRKERSVLLAALRRHEHATLMSASAPAATAAAAVHAYPPSTPTAVVSMRAMAAAAATPNPFATMRAQHAHMHTAAAISAHNRLVDVSDVDSLDSDDSSSDDNYLENIDPVAVLRSERRRSACHLKRRTVLPKDDMEALHAPDAVAAYWLSTRSSGQPSPSASCKLSTLERLSVLKTNTARMIVDEDLV